MQKQLWKQPRTQKVYLHAPLAQRVVMLWPDFKITNYEFADNGKHTRQESTGIILIHGKENEQVDFEATEFTPVIDGIPVYEMRGYIGCDVSFEAFCNFDRNPTIFVKVTLRNKHAYRVEDSIGIFARSGDDLYLSSIHDTGYSTYRPNVGTWYLLKRNWRANGLMVTDGLGYVSFKHSDNFIAEWIDGDALSNKFVADNFYRFHYSLAPGEEAVLYIAQKYGELVDTFDYMAEKIKTIGMWNDLLYKIKQVPNTDNKVYRNVFLSQVTQSLQMLARYPDKELIIPRQGDLGCYIWPWEAAHFLIPLDRIGLSMYTGEAYKYFIETWFCDGGEDDGKIMSNHQQWGNLNGSIIWGVSEHLMYTKDPKEYEYFKPYLDRCLEWIQRERKKCYCSHPVFKG